MPIAIAINIIIFILPRAQPELAGRHRMVALFMSMSSRLVYDTGTHAGTVGMTFEMDQTVRTAIAKSFNINDDDVATR